MTWDRIPVAGPWVTELEAQYAEAATNDWYTHAGQSVGQFEHEFADHLGVAHAAAVPHCTSALHLAMLALDIGPGDEIIVPEAAWVATAAPASYVGATVVMADIDPVSWCVSPRSIAEHVSPRTKAVVTVDLYGSVPDMAAIRDITDPLGIAIIEDAAQSIGSTWRGRPAGTLGDVATFSFHGTKTLTTGEGGMLVTDRADIFERVSRLRDHGRKPGDHRYFVTDEIGYKYRMSSLQAAFGRAQLARVDQLLQRKLDIFHWYEQGLAGHPDLQLNVEIEGTRNTYWMVNTVVDARRGLSTRQMMDLFDAAKIDTRPFFPPLSSLPTLAGMAGIADTPAQNPVAYDISRRSVNLPSALLLTEEDVDRVCDVFLTMLSEGARRHT